MQEKVFRRQIAIAREMNLPFSVHTREALEDTYRILKMKKFQILVESCIVSVVMPSG